MFRSLLIISVLCLLSGCSSGPRTVQQQDGSTYIELSMLEEVSIVRSREISIDHPAHAVVIVQGQSLLAALQKLYPDYWFSELAKLPDGEFDVAIIPRDGLILKPSQIRDLLKRAFENSFKVRISIDDESKVATIKGRIL